MTYEGFTNGLEAVTSGLSTVSPRDAAATSERKCRVCGCTDAKACPGGCYWVEDDLCSTCA